MEKSNKMNITLVKTGKTVKIKPMDFIDLYRYEKYFIEWDTNDLIEKLNKIFPHRKLPEYSKRIKFRDEKVIDLGANVYIPLNSILLPSYIYSRISKRIKDFEKPKSSEKISVDNLSLLDVYQVAPSPEGKFEYVNLCVQIGYSPSRDRYVISSLWLDFKDENSGKSRRSRNDWIGMFFYDMFEDEFELGEHIRTMKKLEGAKYSELDEVALGNILWVERSFVLVVNLFHVLHSNEFNENDLVDSLFRKHSDVIKSFGDEFEDTILPVKAISTFTLLRGIK
jgi:hypothetical protein